MFNPDEFLQSTVQAEGSTKLELLPIGEYPAFVANADDLSKWFRSNTINKGDRAGEQLVAARIPFRIDNADLATKLGRNTLIVPMDLILDMMDDGKTLDMGKGKNVKLNQIRAALGQNSSAVVWSWKMLPGAGPLLVKVAHEPDRNDPTKLYERISTVAPIRR